MSRQKIEFGTKLDNSTVSVKADDNASLINIDKLKQDVLNSVIPRIQQNTISADNWKKIHKTIESSIDGKFLKFKNSQENSEHSDILWKRIIQVVDANVTKNIKERFNKLDISDLTPALLRKLAKLTSNANEEYINTSISKANISVPITKSDWKKIEGYIQDRSDSVVSSITDKINDNMIDIAKSNQSVNDNFITESEWKRIVSIIDDKLKGVVEKNVEILFGKLRKDFDSTLPTNVSVAEHIMPIINNKISELIPNTILPLVTEFLNNLVSSQINEDKHRVSAILKAEIKEFVDHYVVSRLGEFNKNSNTDMDSFDHHGEIDYEKIEKFISDKILENSYSQLPDVQIVSYSVELNDNWEAITHDSKLKYTILSGRLYFSGCIQDIKGKIRQLDFGKIKEKEHWPKYDIVISIIKDKRDCRLTITDNGILRISTDASWLSLDGVSFTL